MALTDYPSTISITFCLHLLGWVMALTTISSSSIGLSLFFLYVCVCTCACMHACAGVYMFVCAQVHPQAPLLCLCSIKAEAFHTVSFYTSPIPTPSARHNRPSVHLCGTNKVSSQSLIFHMCQMGTITISPHRASTGKMPSLWRGKREESIKGYKALVIQDG